MPSIVVCIPVRDERRALPELFTALAAQRGGRFAIAIAFDGCRDGSEGIAEDCAALQGLDLEAVALDRRVVPHAGRARHAAVSLGRGMVGADAILLTTDADTRPATDWIAASCRALATADMVCGSIERCRDALDGWRDPIEAYLDRLHAIHRTIDPVRGDAIPSHWHEGGASIGLTVHAWDRIADVALPASGEDRALVRAARLAGLVVRQDPSVRVRTSARTEGRAVGGLADALRNGRAAAAAGIEPSMEHPGDVIARVRRSAIARTAFPAFDLTALSTRLGVSEDMIANAAASATSADAFATALPLIAGPHRAVPLSEASRLLGCYEREIAGYAV